MNSVSQPTGGAGTSGVDIVKKVTGEESDPIPEPIPDPEPIPSVQEPTEGVDEIPDEW